MNNVAPESVPVKLPAVKLNESPVFGESFVACTDGNWRGVEDVSQNALALYGPEPGDTWTRTGIFPTKILHHLFEVDINSVEGILEIIH
jgi:hypothetical protein